MARRQPIPGVGAHARDRMRERLGRDLPRDEWLSAVARIVERRAALLCAHHHAEHYLHEIGELRLRLVWRADIAMIVTVLPAEAAPAAVVERVIREGRMRRAFTRSPWKGGKRTMIRTTWVRE